MDFEEKKQVEILYTNWQGKTSYRNIGDMK